MPIKKRSPQVHPLEELRKAALRRESDAEWDGKWHEASVARKEARDLQKRIDDGELYGGAK